MKHDWYWIDIKQREPQIKQEINEIKPLIIRNGGYLGLKENLAPECIFKLINLFPPNSITKS